MARDFRITLSRFLLVVLFLAAALHSPLVVPAVAQTELAGVSGRITDSSGAVIVDAEVELKNVETNVSTTVKTNQDGLYTIPSLHPGHYLINVRKTGFRSVTVTELTLNVQDNVVRNFALQVGSISETVTITTDQLNINTTDATVSTVVDRQFAENLPMNGRSFQTLIQLTPGVVLTQTSGDDNGQFSVNGQRAASNYWIVDGVSANIGVGGGANGTGQGVGGALPGLSAQGGTNSLVSVDALQEFRIQTSTYAPEFGRTPGGQISIVTRSGTNQFHGTAFDYLRNDVLDANDWFANYTKQPKPPERQNDFGGTFSGPIVKDRTFFFFSYEGLRLRLPQVAETIVPSVSARQAAIAATQPLLNAFPLPNGADLGGGNAQFNASFSDVSTLDATSLRIDHRFNDKLTVFGRYNYSPSNLISRASNLSSISHNPITIQTGTVGATSNVSSLITNDFRFNYSRSHADNFYSMDNFHGAVPLPASALGFPSGFTPQDSYFQLLILSTGVIPEGRIGGFTQQQYNVVDSIALQKGSHSLKFGIDYRRLTPQFVPKQYELFPVFLDVSSAESGNLLAYIKQSSRTAELTLQNLGAFGQDTWRISPRLTFTYGLRWELDFVPSGSPTLPALANFNLANLSTVSLAPTGTPPYSTTYGNVAPRIGAAYQASRTPGRETILRTGFGVFYDLATQEIGNLLVQTQFPFGASAFVFGGTYPLSPSEVAPPPISNANVSVSGLSAFDPNMKLPYTLQWSAAVDQALGAQQTISASYIGSIGRRLLQSGKVSSPNSTFASLEFVGNLATSDYNALQLQFQRRLSHGLQALASYTWAHSLDTASLGSIFVTSNAFVPGISSSINRGPSDFDVRNALSAGVTYDVPAPGFNAFAKAVIGGWSIQNVIQARSAIPVNVYDSASSLTPALFGATTAIRPDVIPGQPLYLYGAQCATVLQALGELGSGQGCPGGKGFNPKAFASPAADQQGNLSRNALRGFGATQWDLGVHRDFPIRESLKLQFRAEMFNVLNHPNFGPPIGDLSNRQFGLSTKMLGQSLSGNAAGEGGFSALYQIGGPRSIQLALKILF